MNQDYNQVLNTVSSSLIDDDPKTEAELRDRIDTLNVVLCSGRLTIDECEDIAKTIEVRMGVSMGLGAVVDDGDFEPWLDNAKKRIDPFYWDRYKRYLIHSGLPQNVVTKLDQITDSILGRLGNPEKETQWDRRGMVVGHVQSGKTANYTGLITKAADAGYRLIIVIAGIHNNLRNQTQERIDEGFIGRDTGQFGMNVAGPKIIGVGKFGDTRVPVSLTTTLDDFKKTVATTNKSQIESYNVPVVLVIKKNYRTLSNLIDWLRENSAKGDAEMIDQPMLLIDDEADNASINTRYGATSSDTTVSRINGQIRELLKVFHRSCYIGYTATPFANIFIDPESDDEMFGEDLYPKHFIVGLEAPSNYFGGKKIFVDGLTEDGPPTYLRYINDNEDILPIVHKINHPVHELPASLIHAVRAFFVARTIRNLRGHAEKHASMLVNASRFTGVQGLLRNRLHEVVETIINALRIHGARGQFGLQDSEILALKSVWEDEYHNTEFSWEKVQEAMLDSIAAIKVVEVNSNSNDLDYSLDGQTIIAVGGFSLSRGLTLEGLTVTWFLRNTKMYDTLMQMGRWFGYRSDYEDLCRVWMPAEAISWYSHIAEASEELYEELRDMEKSKATPMQFGLAVRSHPSSLLVTARNKLGSGKNEVVQVGLSNRFVETARLSASSDDIAQNKSAARDFIFSLKSKGFTEVSAETVSGGKLLRDVDVQQIDTFLRAWNNADQSIATQIPPLRDYIEKRSSIELAKWDVLIGTLAKGKGVPSRELDWPIFPMERKILLSDLENGFMSIGGSKMSASSRGVERVGLSVELVDRAESDFRSDPHRTLGKKNNYPGHIYRAKRTKPLLALYLIDIQTTVDGMAKIPEAFPRTPVVSWAISFPASETADKKVAYIINTIKQRELFGEADVDEDQETNENVQELANE